MQEIFKFLFNDKVIPVPQFHKLMDISKQIRSRLIFSSDHTYQIESQVRYEVLEEFIKYLIDDDGDQPEILISNINEYEALSHEFGILKNEINSKKNEFGKYLVNLNGVRQEDANIRTIYEELITTQLDEYIEKYGFELMKIRIQTLYNIFNHPKRKLINFNAAYECIVEYHNRTNDSNIFVLLESLDGNKLTQKNIEESYSLLSSRNNHMPKIDFNKIGELFKTQRKQDEIMTKQEKQIEEQNKMNEKRFIELNKQIEEQKRMNENLLNELIKQQEKNETNELQFKKYIETLENKINQMQESQRTTIEKLETKYSTDIKNLEEQIKRFEHDKNYCRPFKTILDKNLPGILQQLRNYEQSPFNRLFIASQSSNDFYNMINPETKDRFNLINIDDFIEFELKEIITIYGIKIFSHLSYFPKSFDIEINGKNVISIKEAKELNGKNKEMILNFNSIQCRKIRFINKGQNWDEGTNIIHLKRIELLSNESKFSKGVFTTFLEQNKNHDPHKCPVIISSKKFCLNSFYLLDSKINTCTYEQKNSWFQIEFTKGIAILNGFRIKRCSIGQMKKYKIICTDDLKKSENEWSTLIEIDEQSRKEHELLDIYEFSQPSPPIKFVRILQTGPNWNDELSLKFFHFDLFGEYI